MQMENAMVEKIAEIIENNGKKRELGHVGLHEARELIMDAGAVLLDVRPPAKVKGENAEEADIPNAYYAPYPSFAESVDILPVDKNTPIVAGCVKGWFANRIMGYLEMAGYPNVYVLADNIENLIEVHKAHASA